MKLTKLKKTFLFSVIPLFLSTSLLILFTNIYRVELELGKDAHSEKIKSYLIHDFILYCSVALIVALIILHHIDTNLSQQLEKLITIIKNLNLKNNRPDKSKNKTVNAFEEIESEISKMVDNINLLTSAIEFNKDSIVITDTKGAILYVNQSMSLWSGYEKDFILRHKPSIFKSGIHTQNYYKDMWDTINEGKVWHGRIFNKSKSHDVVPFSLTITPIKDQNNDITHFVGIHRNISQEIITEEALVKSQNEAVLASKAKSQFLSIMSHEIRTPLNAILGASEIIAENQTNIKDEKWVHILKSSTESLLQIVNDVLDFSKIESGKFELVRVNFKISDLVLDIYKFYEFIAQKKQLQFEVINELKSDTTVLGDQSRLKQILHNLLNNAFKFTERGKIQFLITENNFGSKKGNICFEIRDTGIGISQENVNILFTPFMQADTSIQRRFGGSGLGLAICKQLSEKLGGEIWVQSEFGKGSSFFFTANIEFPNKAETSPHISPEVFDYKDQKLLEPILVVDDFKENLLIMEHFLKSLKLEVQTIDNGKDALSIISKQFFPIIFLDIEMPNMSGMECVQKIKNMQKQNLKKSYIVALSGHVTQDIIDLAYYSGFDAYLPKPIKKQTLCEKIKEISFLLDSCRSKSQSSKTESNDFT